MSKYRRGIAYLRPIKQGDKANSYMVALKMAALTTPELWNGSHRIKPLVLVQHGVEGVSAVFNNREEARSSMITTTQRGRNRRFNKKRGQRSTIGDFKKIWRKWKFK